MKINMKHHVEYTGEGPSGELLHGEFDQDDNDFKAAEKRAGGILGPNVHLASVRMWRADMPKAYTGTRPAHVPENSLATTEDFPKKDSLDYVEPQMELPDEDVAPKAAN